MKETIQKSSITYYITSQSSDSRNTRDEEELLPESNAYNPYVKGCPNLLIPKNKDWSPTFFDKMAPSVLPSRTFSGKLRVILRRKAGKPLQYSPKSFTRKPPAPSSEGPSYSSFNAFYLPGLHDKQLARGFVPRYPASIMVDHDVSAVDWDQFLINLRVAGALRGHDHLIANLIPAPLIFFHAGYGNFWITRGIMSALQRRYIPEVLALVECYQYRFFLPRKLDVFVACGSSRLTGYFPGDESYLHAPPVELGIRVDDESDKSSSSSESDSSDSDEEEYLRRIPRKRRNAVRASRKEGRISNVMTGEVIYTNHFGMEKHRKNLKDRIDLKRQRREELLSERMAGLKANKQGKYRIIVQPLNRPPVKPSATWLTRMEIQERKWGLMDTLKDLPCEQ